MHFDIKPLIDECRELDGIPEPQVEFIVKCLLAGISPVKLYADHASKTLLGIHFDVVRLISRHPTVQEAKSSCFRTVSTAFYQRGIEGGLDCHDILDDILHSTDITVATEEKLEALKLKVSLANNAAKGFERYYDRCESERKERELRQRIEELEKTLAGA